MTDMRKQPLEVVCALIENADKDYPSLLAAQRANGHLAGKWEFPGGKVKSHELPSEAIIREIREELGCVISIREVYPHFDHDYGNDHFIRLMPFLCTTTATPLPAEHSAISWVSMETCDTLDWAEADIPILQYWKERQLLNT